MLCCHHLRRNIARVSLCFRFNYQDIFTLSFERMTGMGGLHFFFSELPYLAAAQISAFVVGGAAVRVWAGINNASIYYKSLTFELQ